MNEWDKAYMNARRHPRTMQAAFGPYTDNRLEPMPEPRNYSGSFMATLYVVAALALAVIWWTA